MVMFKEDDERIKKMERDEKAAKRGPVWRWIRRLIKFSLVLGIFMFIGLTLLTRLAEDNEALQNGLLDFVESASGMNVEVEEFNQVRVFPVVMLKATNATFKKPDSKEAIVTVAGFEYASGFWDLMFSRDRVRALSIKDAFISKEVTGRRDLNIISAGVDPNAMGENKPGFKVTGTWGREPLTISLETQVDRSGQKGDIKSYIVGRDSAFSLSVGSIDMTGHANASMLSGLKVELDEFTDKDFKATGALTYSKKWGTHKLGFDLEAGNSNVEGAVDVTPELMKGDISIPRLHIEDIPGTLDVISSIGALFSDEEARSKNLSLPEGEVEINVSVKEFYGNGANFGNADIPVRIYDDVMTIKSMKGSFSGGKLNANIIMDTSVSPSKLSLEGTLLNWDYGLLQEAYLQRKNLSGTADLHVNLSADGNTVSAMMNALDGKITIIAGEGEFESKALNFWGAGLVNAIMPNISDTDLTKLNCMVGDFTVENGIATAGPLFVDTQRLTVVGEGKVNLAHQRIDLALEPQAKGAALLDIATAVRIDGSLKDPDIGPTTFSLLEKIGGLALGTINPAFLAFTMTDLGLTDHHPCTKFFSKDGAAHLPAEDEALSTDRTEEMN